MTNLLFGHQNKQATQFVVAVGSAFPLTPGDPKLQGVFEAELAGQAVGQQGGLGHQQSDQVVGQKIYPDLLDHHLRCLAAQHLHAQGGLDVAQVQFHVPAFSIELFQSAFGRLFRAQQRRHQDLAAGTQFPHRQGARRLLVLGLAHPVRLDLWLVRLNQVIALTQPLTAAKIRAAPPCAVVVCRCEPEARPGVRGGSILRLGLFASDG